MKTTYTFTVSKPTYCPFSGLHHVEGHRLVLEDHSLSFFAPGTDGNADRQLTDPQPLRTDSDVRNVKDWLAAGVKGGTFVEVGAKGKGDGYVLPERPAGCFAQNVPVPFSRPPKIEPPKVGPPRAAAQQTPNPVVSQLPLPPPR